MLFPIFKFFSEQFRASGNSNPGPSEVEKLIGSGKKISRSPPEERFLEPIQKKNVISIYSGTGDVSQGLSLSTFKKNLHLWKPGAY